MKEIKINDKIYQYCTNYWCDEGGDYLTTEFYDGTENVIRRKWSWKKWAFEKYKVTIPKKIFDIPADSNDTTITKGWWRTKIFEKIELLNREKELSKGELI
jgi:hypothetical protein